MKTLIMKTMMEMFNQLKKLMLRKVIMKTTMKMFNQLKKLMSSLPIFNNYITVHIRLYQERKYSKNFQVTQQFYACVYTILGVEFPYHCIKKETKYTATNLLLPTSTHS